MGILNPRFESPGANPGEAEHWTLLTYVSAERIAGFGPEPYRAWEDFEQWFEFKSAFEDGVLFLDEIGEMPPELQVRLLRAIQNNEIRRVGSEKAIKIDVRIVAATNRDLRAMVEEGSFREDLYFRLKGCVITLPPLRERGRDVILLARSILKKHFPNKRLSRASEALLLRYSWPGNIRELENAILHSAISVGRTIDSEDIDTKPAYV